jgi:hypothetical protein
MTRFYRVTFLAAGLLTCVAAASAEERIDSVFPFRNHNPFLQIYGLPTFQTARLAEPGSFGVSFSLDIASISDTGESPQESLVIDGESYIGTLSMRRRMAEWLELGVDVPLVSHAGGFMDGPIESFHDLFGLNNSKRSGPRNQIGFVYENIDATRFEINSPTFGVGDIQLTAAVPIGERFAIRSAVKLPSGDAAKLTGSGAVDLSLGLYASGTTTVFERELGLSGFGGVLTMGDGDVLPELQRRSVAYGGISARWNINDRFGLVAQVYGQGSYFKSDLPEIGASTVQFGFGGDYRPANRGLLLRLAIVEDIAGKATPDVALHFSISSLGS